MLGPATYRENKGALKSNKYIAQLNVASRKSTYRKTFGSRIGT